MLSSISLSSFLSGSMFSSLETTFIRKSTFLLQSSKTFDLNLFDFSFSGTINYKNDRNVIKMSKKIKLTKGMKCEVVNISLGNF